LKEQAYAGASVRSTGEIIRSAAISSEVRIRESSLLRPAFAPRSYFARPRSSLAVMAAGRK